MKARGALLRSCAGSLRRARARGWAGSNAARWLISIAAATAATAVVWHTARFLWTSQPVLPVFDGWAPWTSLRGVIDGSSTPSVALTALHNEHRVVLARLLFVADLFAGGRDRIATAASFAFQALQASIWLVLLARAGGSRPIRLLTASAVVAMLATLRQGDNFVSGFQAQFTGVFALDVAAAMLLLGAEARRGGAPVVLHRLLAGAALLAVEPMAMANGFLAAPACVFAGLWCRSPGRWWMATAASVAFAASVAAERSLPGSGVQGTPLAVDGAAVLHAAAYLGGTVTSGRVPWALAAGFLGLASCCWAAALAWRSAAPTPAERVAVQVMLFCVLSAAATAVGRIGAGFGIDQALSGRYATASATFWSATIVFWASRGAKPSTISHGAGWAHAAVCALLLFFVVRDQRSYDRTLLGQSGAARRVLEAFEGGTVVELADLAAIGVDALTAESDVELIERVRSPTPFRGGLKVSDPAAVSRGDLSGAAP